mgnify:FL=1
MLSQKVSVMLLCRKNANLDAAYKIVKINFELIKLYGIPEGNVYPDLSKGLT